MIHISGNYYLDGEPMNIVLRERKIIKSGKRAGEEHFVDLGYYANAQQALDALVHKKIRISAERATQLRQLNDDIGAIHKDIKTFCKKFEKEIREKLKEGEDERAVDASGEAGNGGIEEGE